MVTNANSFAEKINSASPEYREILLEIGRLMKDIIDKLADNMINAEVCHCLERKNATQKFV